MLTEIVKRYVKVATSVASPMSIPRLFGLFIDDNESSNLLYFPRIFLVFLFNTMSQITNVIVFCRVRNVSSRIERLTYFVEAAVAATLYGWMLRFSNRIMRTVPVRLSAIESLLLLAPPMWMLAINVRFSVRHVKTTRDTAIATMNCLGRSFGCLILIFMATLFAARLMGRWTVQVTNYSACLRLRRCQCELNCANIATLDSIQKHISAERAVIFQADEIFAAIPYCTYSLVLAFSCLHCPMISSAADTGLPFLNPDDPWSFLLAMETFVHFMATTWSTHQLVEASCAFRREVQKIRHMILVTALRDQQVGPLWLGSLQGWRTGMIICSSAVTYAILMRSASQWQDGRVYFDSVDL